MKPLKLVCITISLLCMVIANSCSQTTSRGNSLVLGVFAGTSLCGDIAKPLLKIPLKDNCDRIKWTLTLYQDSKTNGPTAYKLTSEYGYHVDNRTYVTKGKNTTEGKWRINKGTKTDPNAVVYQLNPDNPELSISFMKLDNNLLHLLDKDKSLMVGDDAQSYTLSRIEN